MQYTVQLVDKREVAQDTMAFFFTKPEGFTFTAGQSIDLFLIDPPETDAEGNKRAFSLASAPFEEHLMITTRMRDTAFKRVLKDLPLGTELGLDGPFGSFTLHKDTSKPAVLLTGGIGVTPFYSMVKQAVHDQTTHQIYFFYSNHHPTEAAYLTELQQLAQQHEKLVFIPTMTDTSRTDWNGEHERISMSMLQKYIPNLQDAIFYICGPASMVRALRTVLAENGMNEDNIRTEDFAGY